MLRHPDIEIYVRSTAVEDIVSWLAQAMNVTTPEIRKKGSSWHCTVADVPVMLVEQAAGKNFTSVWLDSDQTPWATDLECAKAAYEGLQREIRCIRSGWSEEQDPDEWWSVGRDGIQEILWTD
ncbi:hypothetical protein ACKC9G_11755 [Pokkaliibacter sp. CJK22405]|uniref:hypothetical protein n=1 Tax=Pokkaliibacter sp. CJK22405 TaxID=3384615 RepID=UPI0039855406